MITYKQYCGFANKMEEIETAILNGEVVAGEVWKRIIGELDIVDTESDMNDAGRWTVPVSIVFKLDGRFFRVWLEQGLTEYQNDEWEDQKAVEVRPTQITITSWVGVDND